MHKTKISVQVYRVLLSSCVRTFAQTMHTKKIKNRSQNKIRLARESTPSARRLSSLAPLESSLYQLSNGARHDSLSARGAKSAPIRNAEEVWKNTKNHAFFKQFRSVFSTTKSPTTELSLVGKLVWNGNPQFYWGARKKGVLLKNIRPSRPHKKALPYYPSDATRLWKRHSFSRFFNGFRNFQHDSPHLETGVH